MDLIHAPLRLGYFHTSLLAVQVYPSDGAAALPPADQAFGCRKATTNAVTTEQQQRRLLQREQ